jgi:competence protein ComEC
VLRWLGRQMLEAYIVTLVLWLTVTPLAASRYALVSPAGLLLGPPLTLLTSIALLAGFVFLLLAAISPVLAAPFVPLIHGPLALCVWMVDAADTWRLGCIYVGEVPTWWLAIFYAALLVLLAWPGWRPYWRRIALAGTGWLAVGVLAAAVQLPANELRVTFLAVGHGGCTVLETPDGRTLLYDAGAIAGPDVSRRQIAPYLWSRGVRRIDEVFVSHADLDHFNGLVGLLDRFAIGQVTLTPSFADKETAAVRLTLDRLRERSIPMRIVKAGDRLTAGTVELRVLHPPAVGPPGNENARSLVLEVRHADYILLLTGDLEGEGTPYLVDQPRRRVDVLMAPHHGSAAASQGRLAEWARPRVVVSCQGPPRSVFDTLAPYRQPEIEVLPTYAHGAVTARTSGGALIVETFVTRKRIVLRPEHRVDAGQ